MLTELTGVKTEADAKKRAAEISVQVGGYVTVVSLFGLFASTAPRLNVFSPSDSAFNWYAHAGQIKQFTNAQRITDQNATPATR